MNLSYITADRQASRDAATRQRKPVLADARRLPDEALQERLGLLGISLDREALSELCDRYTSAEGLSKDLVEQYGVRRVDTDWVWLCTTVLWERWFPEVLNLEMIDDKAQLGYKELEKGAIERACEVWLSYWTDVRCLMAKWDIRTIGEFDKKFPETQFLSNVCQDLEMELGNASLRDPKYHLVRIDYCESAIGLLDDQDELSVRNMRRAIAESFCNLGAREKADALYERWLKENPRWGWGWIGWSDLYGLSGSGESDDRRAEDLLTRALKIEGIEDKQDVLERLSDVRERLGGRGERKEVDRQPHRKIGRNEPCPCGSGKKHKRCCGR